MLCCVVWATQFDEEPFAEAFGNYLFKNPPRKYERFFLVREISGFLLFMFYGGSKEAVEKSRGPASWTSRTVPGATSESQTWASWGS